MSVSFTDSSAVIKRYVRDARSQRIASSACALFLTDYTADYQIVEVSALLLDQAVQIAQRHSLRGYDAVQLAAGMQVNQFCLTVGLPPVIFVSADRDLNAAASAEGLGVDDPNAHP